jgi:hypothetical protein
MTTQLLIYKSAVPVSRTTHGNCSVDMGANFTFSGQVNSVPLMAVEFPLAMNEYPIVFGGSDTEISPVALLGVRDDENLYLDANGAWKAKYIPAFVRRYPFVFSHADGRFVLCVDEAFPGLNTEGRGHRLFAEDGSPTPYTDGILRFLQDYQTQFTSTRGFCTRIQELGLLEPMQLHVTIANGTQMSLSGFLTVSRERLKALPPETLAELAKNDALELIYLHLHSLRHFDALRERLSERLAEQAN